MLQTELSLILSQQLAASPHCKAKFATLLSFRLNFPFKMFSAAFIIATYLFDLLRRNGQGKDKVLGGSFLRDGIPDHFSCGVEVESLQPRPLFIRSELAYCALFVQAYRVISLQDGEKVLSTTYEVVQPGRVALTTT